jgi:5-methyltetrahydrofolate--homocysteine methyltransferase
VKGKALINSVTGEEERLEAVLPLAKRYGAAVIGISNDETGISQDPDVRFAVARRIVERAEKLGIPRQDVLIDPLVLPVGAVGNAGPAVFRLLRRVRDELGVNTVCGASNVSFGLPDRVTLNGAFLTMAIANGLTSAITNPLEDSLRKLILAANVMMGHDENCMRWLKAAREAAKAEGGAEAERAARRERRRGPPAQG